MGASCRNAETAPVKECVSVVAETETDGTLEKGGFPFAAPSRSEGFLEVDEMKFMDQNMLQTLRKIVKLDGHAKTIIRLKCKEHDTPLFQRVEQLQGVFPVYNETCISYVLITMNEDPPVVGHW